jgi:hypothetical protein
MATCPNGHEMHAGWVTCATCEAEEGPPCANGHPTSPGSMFCETCGVPLTEAVSADDGSDPEDAPTETSPLDADTTAVDDPAVLAPCANGHPTSAGSMFCETCGVPLTEVIPLAGDTASPDLVSTATVGGIGSGAVPTQAQPTIPPGTETNAPPFIPTGMHAPPAAGSETNGLAIASLVLGILWLGGLGALLALIFGYVSKRNIDESHGRQGGRGLAIAGIVLGWVGIAGLILWIILLVSLNHAVDSALTHTELTSPSGSTGNSGAFTTTPPTDSPNLVSTPAGGTVQTWTVEAKGQGGYTEQVQILLGHAEHARNGRANGQDVAGGACSFDSETDALVPVVINASNTTAKFSSIIGINIGLDGYSDESDNGVTFEGAYTSGTSCSSDDSFGVSSTTADAPGTGTTLDGFFVISNYYTPSDPDGDPSLLGATQLTIDAQQSIEESDDSNETSFSVTSVAGPGAQHEDDEWILNLAGTAPPSGNSGFGNTGSGFLGNTGDDN